MIQIIYKYYIYFKVISQDFEEKTSNLNELSSKNYLSIPPDSKKYVKIYVKI